MNTNAKGARANVNGLLVLNHHNSPHFPYVLIFIILNVLFIANFNL